MLLLPYLLPIPMKSHRESLCRVMCMDARFSFFEVYVLFISTVFNSIACLVDFFCPCVHFVSTSMCWGQVLGKYRGRANTGKYLDWKEWIPAEALTNLPQKEKGTYKGLIKTPNYWREGRNNLFEYYDQLGMHWSDPDG